MLLLLGLGRGDGKKKPASSRQNVRRNYLKLDWQFEYYDGWKASQCFCAEVKKEMSEGVCKIIWIQCLT